MKSKILLTCALLAFFLGLGLLISGFQGNSSVTASWPIGGSTVQLSGAVKGWRAIAGMGGFVLALILFVWGLISLATRSLRGAKEEALPASQPESEVKKQAVSQ